MIEPIIATHINDTWDRSFVENYLTDENSLFESFKHGTFMIMFTIDSEAYSPIKACFVIYFR